MKAIAPLLSFIARWKKRRPATAATGFSMRRQLPLLFALSAALFAQKLPFDANAMMALKRIADPQISPDGRWVAFSVQTVDLGASKKPTQIWIVPLDGGAPRQITQDGDDNERPRWAPDSKQIAYVSNRGGSS